MNRLSPNTIEYHYQSFRRWVGQQSGTYQYSNNLACPMAEWAKDEMGFPRASAGANIVRDIGKWGEEEPRFVAISAFDDMRLFDAIRTAPLTYEALTKRLDARFTKTGLVRRDKRKSSLPRAYVPTGPLGSFKRGATS